MFIIVCHHVYHHVYHVYHVIMFIIDGLLPRLSFKWPEEEMNITTILKFTAEYKIFASI